MKLIQIAVPSGDLQPLVTQACRTFSTTSADAADVGSSRNGDISIVGILNWAVGLLVVIVAIYPQTKNIKVTYFYLDQISLARYVVKTRVF